MKRVAVFQGARLGVLDQDTPLPPGVWQRGQPRPSLNDAIWARTKGIKNTQFPPAGRSPANCRMCDPGDTSLDCCPVYDNMPLYTDYGTQAYLSSFQPWNQNSRVYMSPPTTAQVVDQALSDSSRQTQMQADSAAQMSSAPENQETKLAGFLAGSGQNHLLGRLGNGQNHLLGSLNPYAPLGCSSCSAGSAGSSLSGIFTDDATGAFTMTGKIAVGAGALALVGAAYMLLRKKRR